MPIPGVPNRTEVYCDDHLAAATDIGKKHAVNEDAAGALRQNGTAILVVADGVSTSHTPHLASSAAIAAVLGSIQKDSDDPSLKGSARRAIAAAHEVVSKLPSDDETGLSPSATIVIGIYRNQHLELAWMGDSRAYLIAPAADGLLARQLTCDHSWANEIVAAGEMTKSAAMADRRAHTITRWLGRMNAKRDGVLNPDFSETDIPPGSTILLTTDGFWNYADDEAVIASLVQSDANSSAHALCQRLIEYANNLGGRDNIGVAILRIPA